MVEARRIGRGVLCAGIAVTLGRWPEHWRHQPGLAVLSTTAIVALAVGVSRARGPAAFRAAAAICLVDAAIVIRAWTARTPLHCDCVRRAGAPALAGWGGVVIAADVALCALAVWLSRPATTDRGRRERSRKGP